jgi:hypothetical protein
MTKLAAVMLTLVFVSAAPITGADERTFVGTISDSLCGASHEAMAKKEGTKVSDRDCVIACLSYYTENAPKLVFVEKGGKVYSISNQKFPGLIRRAGETLSVTGELNGTTLTIVKVEIATMEEPGRAVERRAPRTHFKVVRVSRWPAPCLLNLEQLDVEDEHAFRVPLTFIG